MNKLYKLSVLTTGLMLSGMSMAGSVFTTLAVNASVGSGCTVSATSVVFAATDGSAEISATGSIDVSCTSGVTYNVALDAGSNFDGALGVRTVQNLAGDPIAYFLADPTLIFEWGDSDFANTYPTGDSVSGTGIGSVQQIVVNGILTSNLVPENIFTTDTSYSDIVNVTVHF